MKKVIIKRRLKALGFAAMPLLILLLYLAGSVQVESLHHLVHPDDHITLHSPEQEKDTCHQSIYHAGINHGCAHKSHLNEFKKCTICDYANHSVHLFSIHKIDLPDALDIIAEDHYILSESKAALFYFSSRAPPIA